MKTVISGALAACVSSAAFAGAPLLSSELVVSGLTQPTNVTFDPDDASRMYVIEKPGRIRLVEDGVVNPTPVLDLTSVVTSSTFGGMTGMALAPDFSSSGHVYVVYPTGPGANGNRVEIARYTVDAGDPDVLDPSSRMDVMTVMNGFSSQFHIGGTLAFGPDGYLYIPLGDGTTTGGESTGGARSQSLTSYWGKMLRIDVTGDDFPEDAERNYAIPADNPFVGMGVLDEIWSFGLRNPFRVSFDRETGDLWIADVGLVQQEEIDVELSGHAGGRNYGWNCAEGTSCSTNANCDCSTGELTFPVHTYTRANGCSITGGVVYRGCAIDGMQGRYIYGDWCSGRVWSIAFDGVDAMDEVEHTMSLNAGTGVSAMDLITSFGEDPFGEVYITTEQGRVYKILPAGGIVDENGNGIADSCEEGDPADLNGDGTVDSRDLAELLAAWGACSGCPADLNGDGSVDSGDLAVLLAAWG